MALASAAAAASRGISISIGVKRQAFGGSKISAHHGIILLQRNISMYGSCGMAYHGIGASTWQ